MTVVEERAVVVVGAGPAGTASAILLHQCGHDVLVLDRATFPRDKPCGEYSSPQTVQILRRLGVADAVEALPPHRLNGMRVYAPNGTHYTVDYHAVRGEHYALSIPRLRLDNVLVAGAKRQGIALCERARVTAVGPWDGSGRTLTVRTPDGERRIRARLVIGADGHHSIIAKGAGLAAARWQHRWPRRVGIMAHYENVTTLDRYGAMVVGPRNFHGYSGIAPLGGGLANVAFVFDIAAMKQRGTSMETFFEQSIAALPPVRDALAGARRVSKIHGVGPLAQGARRAVADGVLLVGDAAVYLDPFTGEGVYKALRSAELAVETADRALRKGSTDVAMLRPYLAARRQAFLEKTLVNYLVQLIVHTPRVMNYVTPRLESRPALARQLVLVLGDLGTKQEQRQLLSPVYLWNLLRP
jgi:geranylgeranyl reductase family protein